MQGTITDDGSRTAEGREYQVHFGNSPRLAPADGRSKAGVSILFATGWVENHFGTRNHSAQAVGRKRNELVSLSVSRSRRYILGHLWAVESIVIGRKLPSRHKRAICGNLTRQGKIDKP